MVDLALLKGTVSLLRLISCCRARGWVGHRKQKSLPLLPESTPNKFKQHRTIYQHTIHRTFLRTYIRREHSGLRKGEGLRESQEACQQRDEKAGWLLLLWDARVKGTEGIF